MAAGFVDLSLHSLELRNKQKKSDRIVVRSLFF